MNIASIRSVAEAYAKMATENSEDNLAATDAELAQKKQEPMGDIPDWVPGNIPDEKKKEFAEAAKKAWESDNTQFDFDGRTYKITEKLVGNQDKLDVNNNGKIDGDDLAALRAGKPANEDREKGEMKESVQLYENIAADPRAADLSAKAVQASAMAHSAPAEAGAPDHHQAAHVAHQNAADHYGIYVKYASGSPDIHRAAQIHHQFHTDMAHHHLMQSLHQDPSWMKESTEVNESAQGHYARMTTDHAEKASIMANSYGAKDYHLHMIAHHSHARAAATHEKAADSAKNDQDQADHSGGASYHHEQAARHLKAAKGLMKESTQVNESVQGHYARVATDNAERASTRANNHSRDDYHLHMIAHHNHAFAAKSHEKAAGASKNDQDQANHSGGASYHHDQADYHLKAAKSLMKESVDNPTDKLTLDVPAMIRALEKAREDFKTDADIHNFVQGLLNKKDDTIQTNDLETKKESVQEKLDPNADAGTWIHDFVHSKDPKFAGKSAEERKQQALAAYYQARRDAGLKEGTPDQAKAGPEDMDPATKKMKDLETKAEEAPYTNKADGSDNMVPAEKPSAKPSPTPKLAAEQTIRSVADAYVKMTQSS